MKYLKSTPYKMVFVFLFVCNLPLMAARPSAFNSYLPIIYGVVAGTLLLIVEFRKVFEKLKYFTHKLIGIVKK